MMKSNAEEDSGRSSKRALDALSLVGRHWWWILGAVAVTALILARGGTSSPEVRVSQRMVLHDVAYHELSGVHSFQKSWLAEQSPNEAVSYELPDGVNSTVFALEHVAPSTGESLDALAEASRLIALPTASATFGKGELDRLGEEADTAETRLLEVEERLEVARTEHRRLSASASASQVAIDQAGQETWALASERDLWIRRASEMRIALQAAEFDRPFSASAVGDPETSEVNGLNVSRLLGIAAAIALGLALTALTIVFRLTRARVSNARHLSAITPSERIVDLGADETAALSGDGIGLAGAHHIARMVDEVDGDVLLVQSPLAGERCLSPSQLRRLGRLTGTVTPKASDDLETSAAKIGRVVMLVFKDSSTASELRQDLRRMDELDVTVLTWALLTNPSSPVIRNDRQATDVDDSERPRQTEAA